MNICLKAQAKQQQIREDVLILTHRLPDWIASPCQVTYQMSVQLVDNYYLMKLDVTGSLMVTCQRCAQEFAHDYHNQTSIVVCPDDAVAQSLMSRYECIVEPSARIDLQEIITDELYLFCQEKHEDEQHCALQMHTIV